MEGLELCCHAKACTVQAFRLLNRDKNASRNIYRVAACMLRGEKRPEYLVAGKKRRTAKRAMPRSGS